MGAVLTVSLLNKFIKDILFVASLQAGYASSIEHPRDCERMDATVSEQFVDHYGSVQDVPQMRKGNVFKVRKNAKNGEGGR